MTKEYVQFLIALFTLSVLLTQLVRCPYLAAKQQEIKKQIDDSVRLERHRYNARIELARSLRAANSNYYVTKKHRSNAPIVGANNLYDLVDSVLFYNDRPKLLSIDKDTTELVANYSNGTVVYKVVKNGNKNSNQ